MIRPSLALASVALLVLGCAEPPTVASTKPAAPAFEIQDGAHNAGNPHFYFLPPMVSQPSFSGTLDPTLTATVTVCDWNGSSCNAVVAQFTTAVGDYHVDWHTDQCVSGRCTLDPTKVYRLSVTVGALELGHADFQFFANMGQAKHLETNDDIALVDGRTLPVKFRIETGFAWQTKAPMPTPRTDFSVGVVNGILYAVGGSGNTGSLATVEAYDPATNSWTTKASLPAPTEGAQVGVVNGILYAVGGIADVTVTTVEAYDPATNSWTSKAPVPTARINFRVGVVNGILYVVGGEDNQGTDPGTVEAYDPATNSWTTKAPMPTGRQDLAIGVANGILYAVGGSGPLATVEAYDPATDSWTTKASLPMSDDGLAVGVVNGILYAVGGYNNGPLGTVEAYDPATNSWTTKASMPTPRYFLSVGVVNGVLYAVGGYDGTNALGTLEAFFPY